MSFPEEKKLRFMDSFQIKQSHGITEKQHFSARYHGAMIACPGTFIQVKNKLSFGFHLKNKEAHQQIIDSFHPGSAHCKIKHNRSISGMDACKKSNNRRMPLFIYL
jgi:hypothetical protein